MLKFVVLCVLFCGVTYARPQVNNEPTPIPIVAQYSNNSPDGSFNNTYETANGIRVENTGYLKRITVPAHEDETGKQVAEHEEDIIVQVGSYSYTDNEGNVISLSYVADENGFQPTGDHLPKAPEPDQAEPFARAVGQQQQQITRQTRQQPIFNRARPFAQQYQDDQIFKRK